MLVFMGENLTSTLTRSRPRNATATVLVRMGMAHFTLAAENFNVSFHTYLNLDGHKMLKTSSKKYSIIPNGGSVVI